MPISSKIEGTQKEVTNCKAKVNGIWKQCQKALVKVSGKWKEVWANFKKLGDRVYYEWTESGTYTDRYKSLPTNGVRFRDFYASALNANGQTIGSKGTSNGQWTTYNFSLEGGEVYASVSISVNLSKGTISYTVTLRPNTSCVKVTISVGQVLEQT